MGLIARPVYRSASAPAVDESALAAFGCDVSFVSDEGIPAETLITTAVEQATSPEMRHLMWDVFARVRGEYDAGGMICHPSRLLALIHESALNLGTELSAIAARPMLGLFDRINRVLFEQQTLGWLAESELKVRIYGNGWEHNPSFARLSRGAIENEQMLCAVWRASRINLAAGTYGAVSQPVTDGIAAGGFFLMRFCPADVIERIYPPIAQFCRENAIMTNAALRGASDGGVRRLVSFACRTLGIDVLTDWPDFVPQVLSIASSGRVRSAAAIWSCYPAVAFNSRDELLGLCSRYLYNVPARERLAEQMRRELAGGAQRLRVSIDRQLISQRTPRGGQEVAA
jgi:hypothetical protein